MDRIWTALVDVVKQGHKIVLVKGKTYKIATDLDSGELYVQGEDGLLYLLKDHPDWFGDTSSILPFVV